MTHFTWKSLLPFVLGVPLLSMLASYIERPSAMTVESAVMWLVAGGLVGALIAIPVLPIIAWYQNARANGLTRIGAALYIAAVLAFGGVLFVAINWLGNRIPLLHALAGIFTLISLVAAPWYILRERRYHASLNSIDRNAKRIAK